jgi:hypothetical protein
MMKAAARGFYHDTLQFTIKLVDPAACPITPRAPHTGGGGYPFKTGGRKTPITLVSPGRDYRLID